MSKYFHSRYTAQLQAKTTDAFSADSWRGVHSQYLGSGIRTNDSATVVPCPLGFLSRPSSPTAPNKHSRHIDSSMPPLNTSETWQAAQAGGVRSAMSMQNDNSGGSGTSSGAGNTMNGLMAMENPFDPFLLHPLGELSNDDWARAVASVFGPLDSTAELSFG